MQEGEQVDNCGGWWHGDERMAMRSLLSHPRHRLLHQAQPCLCHRLCQYRASSPRSAPNPISESSLHLPSLGPPSLRHKARPASSLSGSSSKASRNRLISSTFTSSSSSLSRKSSRATVAAADSGTSSMSKPSAKSKGTGSQRSVSKSKPKPDPTFSVPVVLEDSLDDANPELESLLKQLELDGPLALKLAVEGVNDLAASEIIELSLLICDDAYIQNLNNEWRGNDFPTDVLSFPQEQPPGVSSLWLLGDVIISLETAKRQAQERDHDLLDEIRILLVHGLLHVLGFDHEKGPEASAEMEKEELRILQALGWNNRGLIAVSTAGTCQEMQQPSTGLKKGVKTGSRKRRPIFKVVLCDMDGTLLNSKSKITEKTAASLKKVSSQGVKVYLATGKSRPAVVTACQSAGLAGKAGIISEASPGVFVQGLLVYGQDGRVIHSQLLSKDVCIKAFEYSVEEKRPLLGFSGDRIVTLFDHPLIENLHTFYMEPKAEVAPSVDYIIQNFQIQKLLFADTADQVSKVIRPYWSKEVGDLARVVQAQDDMLEIIPLGASKGKGVKLMLDDLGVDPDEVMAIGDGENDIEMLELVGWGVAMGNAVPKTLAVASAQVASNDEDGVAEALERFVLS